VKGGAHRWNSGGTSRRFRGVGKGVESLWGKGVVSSDVEGNGLRVQELDAEWAGCRQGVAHGLLP